MSKFPYCFLQSLAEEPSFIFKSDLYHFVATFIGAPEGLASQSQAQLNFFSDSETKKQEFGQHFGEIHPKSQSTRANGKI